MSSLFDPGGQFPLLGHLCLMSSMSDSRTRRSAIPPTRNTPPAPSAMYARLRLGFGGGGGGGGGGSGFSTTVAGASNGTSRGTSLPSESVTFASYAFVEDDVPCT